MVKNFEEIRRDCLVSRVLKVYKNKLHRQTIVGNLGVYLGILFNKI